MRALIGVLACGATSAIIVVGCSGEEPRVPPVVERPPSETSTRPTSENTRKPGNEPTFFDPDGYYFPAQDVVVAGLKVEYLELQTLEYYYDGASHYEAPRALPPLARLAFTRRDRDEGSTHDCPDPVITRDTLRLVDCGTPLGLVSFDGTFLDKRGQYWNRADVSGTTKAIVLGRLRIVKDGALLYDREIAFTYWEGD